MRNINVEYLVQLYCICIPFIRPQRQKTDKRNCFICEPMSEPINMTSDHVNVTLACATEMLNTVKPVLSGHSQIDKTKILMTYGS